MRDQRRRHQAVIQQDDGDELIVADSNVFTTRRDALEWTFGWLSRHEPDEQLRITAFIYEGRMINVGDEDDPDWVFEPDPTIQAEVIHA